MTTTAAAEEFIRLIEIVSRLRAPDGARGSRADDRFAEAVRARGNIRSPGIDRPSRPSRPRGELGDFSIRRCFLRSSSRKAGTSPSPIPSEASPTSWCAGTASSGRDQSESPLETAGQVRTRWEEIKARSGSAQPTPRPARWHSAGASRPPARLSHRRAIRVGRLRLGPGRPGRGKIQEEVDELRSSRRAPRSIAIGLRKKWATSSSLSQPLPRLGIEPEPRCKANDKFTPVRLDGTIDRTIRPRDERPVARAARR
jgi:hypothetical protein